MNLKLLGAFVLALIVVLGVPLLGGALRVGGSSPATLAQSAPAKPASGSANTPSQTPAAQAPVDAGAPVNNTPSIIDAPPMLDANSLIGTTWQVSHQMGKVEVQFYGGGNAVAKHMLLGELQGNWYVDGSNVVVNAYIGNKAQTIKAQIRGNALYYDGVQITRIR